TPKAMLPRHHGHEQRSIELLAEFGERLRVPNRYLSLAYSVAKFHGQAHRVDELTPKKLLRLLTEIGALRNPNVLEDFIAACEADARGRTGLEDRPYRQAERLRTAHAAATSIGSDHVTDSSLRGAAFGQALEKLRITAIKQALAA
ncbi:MAG: multifunctional CCA tRNA nucleotidyl transferase/2'3'-cyclic phosphodiesterase/2'nucleotidase/phosphatase, partial [Gammaproteobacteria bacterium]|nr:multifunctional CCA tRNA nucleotidyl transferase/2'3'-cyclic phosphodiesterase/2'nucleotidase/phosphatase [Gammaproteobacteria bacterium]